MRGSYAFPTGEFAKGDSSGLLVPCGSSTCHRLCGTFVAGVIPIIPQTVKRVYRHNEDVAHRQVSEPRDKSLSLGLLLVGDFYPSDWFIIYI